MKYLIQTLSYEDKCKMQEQCNRRPKAEGLTFKEYKDVPIKKIIQKIGNKLQNQARRKGLDWDKVTDFENRIKEGRYQFTYEQPVVVALSDGTYLLITGEHRYQAHKGLDLDTMFCCVVEFEDIASQIVFQSNENDEESEFIKNVRTGDDVVLALCNLKDNGKIKDIKDDKEINDWLVKLRQKQSDWSGYRTKFREEYGIVSAVTNYDADARAKWCEDNKPDINFSQVSDDGTVYLNQTFKGGKGKGGLQDLDYDPRCFFNACNKLLEEGVEKVVVVGSFNKADSQKIKKLRDYKEREMIEAWQGKMWEIYSAVHYGYISPVDQIEFRWCPQISGEDMEDFAKTDLSKWREERKNTIPRISPDGSNFEVWAESRRQRWDFEESLMEKEIKRGSN